MKSLLRVVVAISAAIFISSACSDEDAYYLTVSPLSVHFTAKGGTEEITVSSNGYWTYQWNDKIPDWVGVDITSTGLRITVDENTDKSSRTAFLLIFKSVESLQDTFKTVMVEQWGENE
jgi:hypothetical protein